MALSEKKLSRLRLISSGTMLLASLLALSISTQSMTGVPEKIGLSVVSFFQRGFSAIGSFFSHTVTSIAELNKLQKEHDELLARLEQLGRLERSYSELRQENLRLEELLGFTTQYPGALSTARIIGKDPENLHSTFIVDKGSRDGIRKNQAVIAYQDGISALVGRVLEVSRLSSLIIPVYDSSSHIAIRLERTRYDGLVSGTGSRDAPLLAQYVKKRAEAEIQYGDIIITSGLQSIYPAGIVVGRVTKIKSVDYLTSLELEVEPTLDFGRLEYVFIVDNVVPEDEDDLW